MYVNIDIYIYMCIYIYICACVSLFLSLHRALRDCSDKLQASQRTSPPETACQPASSAASRIMSTHVYMHIYLHINMTPLGIRLFSLGLASLRDQVVSPSKVGNRARIGLKDWGTENKASKREVSPDSTLAPPELGSSKNRQTLVPLCPLKKSGTLCG